MIELTVPNSRIVLANVQMYIDGSVNASFVEAIDRLDNTPFYIAQYSYYIEYQDISVFDDPLLEPYQSVVEAMWLLKDSMDANA